MKVGKPSKYKRKFCKIAYEFLSKGFSKEALAGELGISRQCLYEWIEKYPEFGDTVRVAECKAQSVWEDLGMKAVKGEIKGFNSSVWMFVMKNRFGWKDTQEKPHITSQPLVVGLISYADAVKQLEVK